MTIIFLRLSNSYLSKIGKLKRKNLHVLYPGKLNWVLTINEYLPAYQSEYLENHQHWKRGIPGTQQKT